MSDALTPQGRGKWRRKMLPATASGIPFENMSYKVPLFFAVVAVLAVIVLRVRSLGGLLWAVGLGLPAFYGFFCWLFRMIPLSEGVIPYDRSASELLTDYSTQRVQICNVCFEVKQAGTDLKCPCGGYWEDFEKWEWVPEA